MGVYRNMHSALPVELKALLNNGAETPSRDGNTKELLNRTTTLTHPRERMQFHESRRANPFAQIAEALWVLAGRNDITWLQHYLPRAPHFSDDGATWRAGYGPRLRDWPGVYNGTRVDQIYRVASLLKTTPDTRRAVMSLWDPARDWPHGVTKDIPCNNWLHFIARNGKLNLNIATRSNDVWWGWSGINAFEWSVLLEMMAYWAGLEVGAMTTFVSSWHLYERHWKQAARVTQEYDVIAYSQPYLTDGMIQQRLATAPRFATPLDQFDDQLGEVFVQEARMRMGGAVNFVTVADPFLNCSLHLLAVYNVHKLGADARTVKVWLDETPDCDLKLAASEWLVRQWNKGEV